MTLKQVGSIIGLFFFVLGFSQKDKEQLQKQNKEIEKQIAVINGNLAKTKNEARLSVAYLNDVNKKIQLREKVYNNTQKRKKTYRRRHLPKTIGN